MFDKYIDKFTDYLPRIIAALLILIAGVLVIRIAVRLLARALAKTKLEETGSRFLVSALKAAMFVILAVMALSELNVPMSSIIAALSTAGLAIVLGLKDSLSNVAGGFIVMLERPFKVGDYIEINGSEGTVESITLLNTRILTIDNKAVIFPNATVASATVTNYTQEAFRRLELKFSVPYNEDHKRAEAVILQTVEANPFSLDAPDKPFIRVCEHSAHAIIILLRVWVKTENYWELRFGLLSEVKDAFDAAGISIPYEQLDVHLDKPAVDLSKS